MKAVSRTVGAFGVFVALATAAEVATGWEIDSLALVIFAVVVYLLFRVEDLHDREEKP